MMRLQEPDLPIAWDLGPDGSVGSNGMRALQALSRIVGRPLPDGSGLSLSEALDGLGFSGVDDLEEDLASSQPIDVRLASVETKGNSRIDVQMIGWPVHSESKSSTVYSGVFLADIDAKRQLAVIRSIRSDIGRRVGRDYIDALVSSLGRNLGVYTVYIGRVAGGLKRVKMEAVYIADGSVSDMAFEVEGLPCKSVLTEKRQIVIIEGAGSCFPKLSDSVGFSVEGYISIPLLDENGEAFAIMSMLTREPIVEADLFSLVMNIYSDRVSGELLRYDVEQHLDAIRDNLEVLVAERTRRIERMQEDVVRSERLATLGRLTGYVSHELRNPLGTIRNSLATIRRGLTEDQARARTASDRAERAIVRCTGIIEELLSYAKVRDLIIESVNFQEWLDSLIADLGLPDTVDLVLRNECGCAVSVDTGYLYQAVSNVLRNAWQAALEQHPRGGARVSLHAGCRDGFLNIVVRDNGPGIADDVRAQMFDPLYSTKTFGVGLGMSIIQNAIEQHGGTVAVENLSEGGASISLSIPQRSAKG